MALTTTKAAADDVIRKPNLIEQIQLGREKPLFLLQLLTNVSANFVPGMDEFKIHQWGEAPDVEDTLESGADQTIGTVTKFKQTVPCDQDKKNSFAVYDKGSLVSALDYRSGFVAKAPIKHGENMEQYVAGLMRTAADTSITCTGTSPASAGSVANSEMTEADMEELAKAFDDQDLPKEGRRLIVNSAQKHALIRNFGLKDVGASGTAESLRDAYLDRLYGFDVYESTSHILQTGEDAQQAIAFVSEAAFWGMQLDPEFEVERQAQKSRWYMSLRSKFGAKINDFKDTRGNNVTRIWLVGKGTP